MPTPKWRQELPKIEKSKLTEEQKAKFLSDVASGKGIHRTLGDLRVGRTTLKNTLDADPVFAEQYRIAVETPKEALEEFVLAHGLNDPIIALKALDRIDCMRLAHQKRRDDYRDRKLAASTLGGSGEPASKLDLKRLTKEERDQLRVLIEKAKKPEVTENGDGEPGKP